MVEWDCNVKTIGIGDTVSHSDGTDERGITVILQDVSPAGSHKAMFGVYFYWAKDPDALVARAPGEYKSYTDPDGTEWRVYVDSTVYNGSSSTAKIRICFEEGLPAKGDIVSIDVPAEAKEGDLIDLCATIKNVGGSTAKFFLRFYDGTTMIRETLPGNVDPGQTITDVCERFTMPGHAWTGRIDLMRQG